MKTEIRTMLLWAGAHEQGETQLDVVLRRLIDEKLSQKVQEFLAGVREEFPDAPYSYVREMKLLDRGKDFDRAFASCHLIALPVSPTPAFRLGEKLDDPLAMYLSDILTVPASLAGIPAISIPCGKTSDGRPIGLQLMAPAFGEDRLLTAAFQAENMLGYNRPEN